MVLTDCVLRAWSLRSRAVCAGLLVGVGSLLALIVSSEQVEGVPAALATGTYVVNTPADEPDAIPGDGICAGTPSGSCSLRAAIWESNATTGLQEIILPAGTYALSIPGKGENQAATGDLDITGNLVISGSGQDATLLDGSSLDRVFEVLGPATVSISGVTIQGGNPGTSMGGPQVYGGGISIFGNATLTLDQVTLQDNTAYQGGGLENNGGTANLSRVTVRRNNATYMGGIHSTGVLHLVDCTVEGNTSTFYSAGVHSDFSLLLENSMVSGNNAGTHGGGVYIHGGTAEIRNSTVSGNQVKGFQGGGVWVYYQAHVSIANSTISNNTGGGGIYNYHEGPGPQLPDPNISLISTLLSENTHGNCAKSATAPPYQSLGHNLDSGSTCSLGGPGDLANTPGGLGPLQYNGGPTYTRALLPGSAAVDAGDNANCPATDQRGIHRPLDGNGDGIAVCDIGAFEAGAGSVMRLFLPSISRSP